MPLPSIAELTLAARHALTEPRHTLADAPAAVPDRAGLYALHGRPETWRQLGLGEPPDDRPLYVGMAEDSMVTRDFTTHFQGGRTGQSTVRRSFAALLRGELGLLGIPRNLDKPERPANFALSPEHDATLTAWMNEHLTLGAWITPDDCDELGPVELHVLAHWCPPLNLRENMSQWQDLVSDARMVMAADARAWASARGFTMKRHS